MYSVRKVVLQYCLFCKAVVESRNMYRVKVGGCT